MKDVQLKVEVIKTYRGLSKDKKIEIALEIIPWDTKSCMSSGKIVTKLKCI